MISDVTTTDELAYPVLRLALIEHNCPPSELTESRRDELRHQASLARKIEQRVLASDLAKRISISDDEIEAAKADLAESFENPEDCQAALEREGIDETSLRAGLYQAIWVERVMALVRAEIPYPDKKVIRDYYQNNPARFERPERRQLSQILITINDEFAENSAETAKARISELHQTLVADPEQFGSLALQHSECPSAMQAGQMGEFEAGQLYPELDAVAFRLEQGEMSEVLESELGFHLLRCTAIAPARKLPFAEVKQALGDQLWNHQQRLHERSWLAGLAKNKLS